MNDVSRYHDRPLSTSPLAQEKPVNTQLSPTGTSGSPYCEDAASFFWSGQLTWFPMKDGIWEADGQCWTKGICNHCLCNHSIVFSFRDTPLHTQSINSLHIKQTHLRSACHLVAPVVVYPTPGRLVHLSLFVFTPSFTPCEVVCLKAHLSSQTLHNTSIQRPMLLALQAPTLTPTGLFI